MRDTADYLERLDENLAALQRLAHLARRYADWCDAHYAELDTQRRELAGLMDVWLEEMLSDSSVSRVHHEHTTTLSR